MCGLVEDTQVGVPSYVLDCVLDCVQAQAHAQHVLCTVVALNRTFQGSKAAQGCPGLQGLSPMSRLVRWLQRLPRSLQGARRGDAAQAALAAPKSQASSLHQVLFRAPSPASSTLHFQPSIPALPLPVTTQIPASHTTKRETGASSNLQTLQTCTVCTKKLQCGH